MSASLARVCFIFYYILLYITTKYEFRYLIHLLFCFCQVASKPYQVASGAELTKLCNHKRKLLATLQARALSPATPPPQNIEPKKGKLKDTIA